MTKVNMHEAKTNLSRLVASVENGDEPEVIITRNGIPVARIIPLASAGGGPKKRTGIAEGKFGDLSLEEFNADDEEIAREFYEKPLFATPAEFNKWLESKGRRRKKSA